VSSSYRFSGPFVVRLMGLCLVLGGLVVLLLAALVALTALPGLVLLAAVIAVSASTIALGVVTRRRAVVRLDGTGYRVRFVRGAGVHEAMWNQVEDVATTTVAGQKCVLLRLRDGRSTTVPVGVLAGGPDAFVDDVRTHLGAKPRR